MKLKRTLILAGIAGLALMTEGLMTGGLLAQAQEQEKATPEAAAPAAPAKPSTIGMEKARAIAVEKVPEGKVKTEEIKRSNDLLFFYFEFEIPGKKGLEVVTVNAVSGEVLSVTHKAPWQIRRDAKSKRRRV
jgi:uncharacterized membrane protein YkoI